MAQVGAELVEVLNRTSGELAALAKTSFSGIGIKSELTCLPSAMAQISEISAIAHTHTKGDEVEHFADAMMVTLAGCQETVDVRVVDYLLQLKDARKQALIKPIDVVKVVTAIDSLVPGLLPNLVNVEFKNDAVVAASEVANDLSPEALATLARLGLSLPAVSKDEAKASSAAKPASENEEFIIPKKDALLIDGLCRVIAREIRSLGFDDIEYYFQDRFGLDRETQFDLVSNSAKHRRMLSELILEAQKQR